LRLHLSISRNVCTKFYSQFRWDIYRSRIVFAQFIIVKLCKIPVHEVDANMRRSVRHIVSFLLFFWFVHHWKHSHWLRSADKADQWALNDSLMWLVLAFRSLLDLSVEINYNKKSISAHWSVLSAERRH